MKANQKARNNKAVSSVFTTLLVLPILIAIITALFMLTSNIIALTQIPQNVNEITVEQLTKSDIVKGLQEDQYFWEDNFEGNKIQWHIEGTAEITDEYYWIKQKSLKITTQAGKTSIIQRPFPWRAYRQVEIQISFTIDQNEQYKNFSIRLGNHTNKGKITINTQNNNISYLNNSGEYTRFDENIALHKDSHCWHTIKLVIDFEKGEYHSFILNEKIYDLRGVLLNNSKPKIGHERIVVQYSNRAPTFEATSCVDNFKIREISQMHDYIVKPDTTIETPINNPPIFSSPNPSNNSNTVSTSISQLSIIINDPEGDTFNWKIETSPNIGSNSSNNENNGTKTCSISNIDFDTTYTWYVNATDGNSWTNETFTFTTIEDSSVLGPPTSFTATTYNSTQIDLSWTQDSSATHTYIEYLPDWYIIAPPWNREQGFEIYNNTGVSHSHTGLEADKTYHYQAWSYNSLTNQYSTEYAQATNTTQSSLSDLQAHANGPYSANINIFSLIETISEEGNEFELRSEVISVDFNHDSSLLAVGSMQTNPTTFDNEVYIYDTSSWAHIETLSDSATGSIWSVNFNHDGSLLAVGSGDFNVYIYDTTTWNNIQTLTDSTLSVRTVNFNHDSSLLAVGSNDFNVYIYDTTTWNNIQTLTDSEEAVKSVSFNHDGSLLAVGSYDEKVYIYDTTSWNNIQTLTDSTDWIYSVNFNHNSSLLAVGSRDNNIYIYDTTSWNNIQTLTDATFHVLSVNFNHNSSLLAAGTRGPFDTKVYIYDTTSWNNIQTLTDSSSTTYSVNFNHDGSLLAVGSHDEKVYIYDASGTNQIKFIGSATGGTPPYTYNWNFGDETTSNQQNPTKIYTAPREYTVILTVTDSSSAIATDTTTATITDGGSGSSFYPGNYNGVWTDGDYIYAVSQSSGIYAFSFDGNSFTLKDNYYYVGQGGWFDVWGDGNYIYGAKGSQGIYAFTFNENGTEEFWLKDTHYDGEPDSYQGGVYRSVWGDGTFIYATSENASSVPTCDITNSIRVYSFNDEQFTLIDKHYEGGLYRFVWGDGTYIYTTTIGEGIHAYSFDGNNLLLLNSEHDDDFYSGVWGDGEYVYVASHGGGIKAYLFDGTEFELKDEQKDGGVGSTYLDVWGDGNYVYTACMGGLKVYSFDGSEFNLEETFYDSGSGRYSSVWGDTDYVYVACSNAIRAYNLIPFPD